MADPVPALQALRVTLWEAVGTSQQSSKTSNALFSTMRGIPAPQNYVNICGVMLSRRVVSQEQQARHASTGRAFIQTPAMLTALHSLALAMQSRRSVLVSGPSGCGKSSLILELARATSNHDVVELYMDAHVDSKALLGSYMCSSTPGEFFWQPGPLAQVGPFRTCCQCKPDTASFEHLRVPAIDSRALWSPTLAQAHAHLSLMHSDTWCDQHHSP